VEARLEQLAPRAAFIQELQRGEAWKDQAPAEILHRGSGWGTLEALRRQATGEAPFAEKGLDFGGALGAEQQPWLELLQTGRFPDSDSDTPAGGILVQAEWHRLLADAVQQHPNSGWEAWLHLGNMRLHEGDADGARQAWETSLARKRTPWALRNLAVLARRAQQWDEAASLYQEAQKLKPDLLPLLVETGRMLIDSGKAKAFLALLAGLPDSVRNQGRVHLLEVEAGLAAHDLDRVGDLLNRGFEIVDYQEGDQILTDLWFRYHAERISQDEHIPVDEALLNRARREHPLPALFDFRMTVE
jgi:tetratricopeptide (TPR) repeat protein